MKYRNTQGVPYSIEQLEKEVQELKDTPVERLFLALKERGYLDSFYLEMNFYDVCLALSVGKGGDVISVLEEVDIPYSRIEGGLPEYQNTRAKLCGSLNMLKFVTEFDKMCFLDKAHTDPSLVEFPPIDLYHMGGVNYLTYTN